MKAVDGRQRKALYPGAPQAPAWYHHPRGAQAQQRSQKVASPSRELYPVPTDQPRAPSPGEKDLSGKHAQTLATQPAPFFLLLGPSSFRACFRGRLTVQGSVSRKTGLGSSSPACVRLAASFKGSTPSQSFPPPQQAISDPSLDDCSTPTPQMRSLACLTSLRYFEGGFCHLQPKGPWTILALVVGLRVYRSTLA